jgi:5-methylcytosine-specific restriction enzyme A
MTRAVDEWIGATPDSVIPPRVRVRVFERCDGRCGECRRKIGPADTWIVEHLIALVNGGQNRETNLGITCGWCKPQKDARDVAQKSHNAKVRARHLGVKPDRPSFQTNRNGRFRKKMNGEVIRRSEQ